MDNWLPRDITSYSYLIVTGYPQWDDGYGSRRETCLKRATPHGGMSFYGLRQSTGVAGGAR